MRYIRIQYISEGLELWMENPKFVFFLTDLKYGLGFALLLKKTLVNNNIINEFSCYIVLICVLKDLVFQVLEIFMYSWISSFLKLLE